MNEKNEDIFKSQTRRSYTKERDLCAGVKNKSQITESKMARVRYVNVGHDGGISVERQYIFRQVINECIIQHNR